MIDAIEFLPNRGESQNHVAYDRNALNGAHVIRLSIMRCSPHADAPTLVFLPGYRSDRMGGKALHLEAVALWLGICSS